jgi:hypothetical protein
MTVVKHGALDIILFGTRFESIIARQGARLSLHQENHADTRLRTNVKNVTTHDEILNPVCTHLPIATKALF